jgi:hypothetical protein
MAEVLRKSDFLTGTMIVQGGKYVVKLEDGSYEHLTYTEYKEKYNEIREVDPIDEPESQAD